MCRQSTAPSTRPAALLLGAALLLYPAVALAQPANDTCATAQVITLPFSDATILASSANSGLPSPSCDSSTDPNGRFDVWYQITPGADTAFSYNETSSIDTFHAIYTGTCGSLTQVHCTDAESGTFNMCAGVAYYVRVGAWSSTSTPTGNYNINFTAGAAPPPAAANDACTAATVINPASLPYSDTADGRTNCARDIDSTCNSSGPTETRNGVWYAFTPTCTGSYTLAETSANDTVRAVFTATDPNTPCTTLTQVRCDDTESVTFNMNAGTTYYILCGMWSSTTNPSSSYTVTLATATTLGLTCNAASPASLQAGGNTVLTATVGPVCAAPATTSATVNVNLTNIGGAASVAMLDDGVPPDAVAGDWIYTVSATVAPATTLGAKTLAVSATDDQARVATPCNITVTVIPPPPANDECAGAIAITCGSSATVDNTGATTAGSDPFFACRVGGDPNQGQGARSTWYTFVAASNSATIDTEGSSISDTMLHVLSGTCGSLTVIGCDDDGGTGLLSLITLNTLTPGNTYYIEAANYSPATTPGNMKVNVSCVPPPPPPAHDVCGGAVAIACGSSNTTDNTYATTDANDPTFACAVVPSAGARSLWYTFVPTGSTATIDTETSVVTDTLLQVFSGTCGGLTVIGCDDDSGTGLHSLINLTGLTPGTTYYIEAANYGAGTVPGNITVNVACGGAVPCPGDADGDNDVDQDDLDLTLFNFGTSGWPPNTNGDVDGDGDVDQDDLDLVLFYFGTSCP